MSKPGFFITSIITAGFVCAAAFAQSPSTGATKRAAPPRPVPLAKSGAASPVLTQNAQKLPSEPTVNEFMRRMFGYDSTIHWKVLQITPSEVPNVAQVTISINEQQRPWMLYVSPDGQHAFVGEQIPFGADPFAPARNELETKARGPSKGAQNAPVTIVEFSDLQCPHCKQAHPTVERLIADNPGARRIFENFPLEQIHKWANLGARYVNCIDKTNNDAVWRFLDGVFNEQNEITEQNASDKFNEIARAAGADPNAISNCAGSAEAKADVIQSYELGVSLGVTGTPTLFINGRKITNVNAIPYDQLKAMVQFEAQQGGK